MNALSSILTEASTQWFKRPDDQRFTSLDDLQSHCDTQRGNSRAMTIGSRQIEAQPVTNDEGKITKGLVVVGPDGRPTTPSNWAFGQLATLSEAPAGYLRKLSPDLASDCINYGLARRSVEEVGALIRRTDEQPIAGLAALTGPRYGRIWNNDIVRALRDRFGDGVTGDFTVPGEFGVALEEVTKANTTLFASDRDMFVFLADEKHRIEISDDRDGQPGTLARGFFVSNSEVGAGTMSIKTFLYRYACCNRIVWGAQDVKEIKIRHTSMAPQRFIEDVTPALEHYAQSSTRSITEAIEAARNAKIGTPEDVEEFLVKRRFSVAQAKAINLAHVNEEGKPIESIWDATQGITAYAKGMGHQDARVEIETRGGDLLNLTK